MTLFLNQTRNKIISLCDDILLEKINLLDGCRKISSLSWDLNERENEIFYPFIAIDSSTDHLPLGEMRQRCSASFLEKADIEINECIQDSQPSIFLACRELIAYMESQNNLQVKE